MRAAGNTFSEKLSSPLVEDSSPAQGSQEGRHRLAGAFAIACDRIQPDPDQPRRRINVDAQNELVESVKRLGILQPITVRYVEAENIYRIITGERRYLAACEVGLPEIPCWVQSPKENEILLHQIVENWQRSDMHPYDLAHALARFRDANRLSQRGLARETGKSEGEISKLLAILDLAPEVQKVASEDTTGRITRRHLYAVRALPAGEQVALITKAADEAINAADMERLARQRAEAARGRTRRGAPVSHRRFKTSQATVTITFRKKDVSAEDILAALDEARGQTRQAEASGQAGE